MPVMMSQVRHGLDRHDDGACAASPVSFPSMLFPATL